VKFGVLQFFSWSRRIPLEVVYQRAFERIEIMDRNGYDCVWLAEHHFNTYSVCPSVTLMGTHIAARTKHLRIGTAVTLAGLYHPLRLAEELAMLDIFSGGRLNWGAGRGFDPTEFRAFEVDAEDSRARLYECVEIVLQAWDRKRFSHDGKFWRIRDIEVLPQPLQQPKPPFWMAASSPEAVKSAAELGYSILQDPHSSHAAIGAKRALYRETLETNGFSAGREIPTARLLAIGKTREEAIVTAREGAQWTIDSYNTRRGDATGKDPIESYMDETIIYGTAEEVADKLIQLREEIGLDYLIASPLSHETFMLLTERVLPRLT
jgi:alkanesulfonate monooxygenase SsuD/methylene tetrahydromethanopterin reductase-like flavin-dependent oxidoreductase (luciferase family)